MVVTYLGMDANNKNSPTAMMTKYSINELLSIGLEFGIGHDELLPNMLFLTLWEFTSDCLKQNISIDIFSTINNLFDQRKGENCSKVDPDKTLHMKSMLTIFYFTIREQCGLRFFHKWDTPGMVSGSGL